MLLARRGEGEEIGRLLRELKHIQAPGRDAAGILIALSAFEVVARKDPGEVERAAEQAARLFLGRRFGRAHLDE